MEYVIQTEPIPKNSRLPSPTGASLILRSFHRRIFPPICLHMVFEEEGVEYNYGKRDIATIKRVPLERI